MPELPDITIYLERLDQLVRGRPLEKIRFPGPFLLRTAVPPIDTIFQQPVQEFRRIGKRIVLVFPEERYLVLHLMISGRLHWRARNCQIAGKGGLAAFDFPNGSLLLTEAGSKKRASLHLVEGNAALAALDPGGKRYGRSRYRSLLRCSVW